MDIGTIRKDMELKIHDRGVISLCDSELIGKCFEDSEIKLDVTERFFKGENRSEEFISELLKVTGNATIVGKKSIEFAIKQGIIEKAKVRAVKNVLFAYVFAV